MKIRLVLQMELTDENGEALPQALLKHLADETADIVRWRLMGEGFFLPGDVLVDAYDITSEVVE